MINELKKKIGNAMPLCLGKERREHVKTLENTIDHISKEYILIKREDVPTALKDSAHQSVVFIDDAYIRCGSELRCDAVLTAAKLVQQAIEEQQCK